VSVALLLLIAAGLFIRTLQNIRGLDLGVQADGIVSFAVQPGRFGMTTDRSKAYVRELLERVRRSPGVQGAAFTWTTSFSFNRNDMSLARTDAPTQFTSSATTAVSQGYFETVGTPLIAGRDFTAADMRESSGKSGVVIISRRLASEMFPGGSAIGSRLLLKYPEGKVVEVIGIAGDVRGRAVTQEPERWTYTPAVDPSWGTILVRSSLPAEQMMATIREVARSVDPIVSPHDLETFGTSVDRALSEQRLFARVSGIFAVVAAVLAGIGIYGMMAGAVLERRKEFGIRLALGARATAVLSLVLRSALTLAVIGVVVGLGGAAAMRRLVESRLFGVTPLDPITVVAASVGVLILSVVASLLPALRASRVDAVTSLRVE
jgi:predicted permease